MSTPNILALSDEDFLNAQPPVVEPTTETPAVVDQPDPAQTGADAGGEQDQGADGNVDTSGQGESQGGEGDDDTPPPVTEQQGSDDGTGEGKDPKDGATDQGGEAADTSGKAPDAKDPAATGTEGKDPAAADAANPNPASDAEKAAEPINYEDQYKKVMAPFKANGKTVELRSPEEAVRLMQLGANYSKKMAELQPSRNVVRMLKDNGLLDEDRLSFLIDIDKKNPEAIKKLLKDAEIDPLTIDIESEGNYTPGAHRVTEEESRFRTALDDVKLEEGGQETVKIVLDTWDNTSKDFLWKNPEVLETIRTQRTSGIYDRIVAEMDRQKLLGHISASTPFLQAYKTVGDQLAASNGFQDLVQQTVDDPAKPSAPQPQVIETKAAAPKSPVANSAQALAAAPSRAVARTAKQVTNPLAMSDEEFLAQIPK